MTVLAALLAMLTGACWLAAVTHLIAGLRQTLSRTHLAFALLAAIVGLNALSVAWLHHATELPEYLEAMSWASTSGTAVLAVLPWFAYFYTGATPRWMPAALSCAYVAAAALAQILPFGLFLDAEPRLIRFELPWGELATVHDGRTLSGRAYAYWVLHACAFGYLYYACSVQYRRGQQRRALTLAACTTLLLAALLANILVSMAGMRSVFFSQFAFAALILVMMSRLGGEERFRTLVTQAGDGIFIADSDGRYVDVNPAGCAMLGYTLPELRRLNIFDIVTPEDRQSIQQEKAALFSGQPVRLELQFRRKDGSLFPGELSGRLLSDGRMLGLVRDTTERRELLRSLEERVAVRTAEYAELNRQLESFSYSVSHDLRAPVRAIAGFSSLLLQDHSHALDDRARKHLTRIHAAAGHMNELIEGLLQLAHVSHHALKHEHVDLSLLVQDEIRRLRERDPARVVSVVCPPAIAARGDARLLRIMMYNLLENAWKYTGATTAAHIEFGRQAQNGEAVYFVRDNGAGFDMQFADQLFKPFQRLHSAAQFSGAGIGLATVARIIERHGGRIWADAAPDNGATFYFTLGARAALPVRGGRQPEGLPA
jgi:PAS domain S-box-containing protein